MPERVAGSFFLPSSHCQREDDLANAESRVAGRAGVTVTVKYGCVAGGQKTQTLTSVADMRERRRES